VKGLVTVDHFIDNPGEQNSRRTSSELYEGKEQKKGETKKERGFVGRTCVSMGFERTREIFFALAQPKPREVKKQNIKTPYR